MSTKPIDQMPDWPPQRSAIGEPDGKFSYGSTGQLFVAKNGQWIRVRKPAVVTSTLREAPHET